MAVVAVGGCSGSEWLLVASDAVRLCCQQLLQAVHNGVCA